MDIHGPLPPVSVSDTTARNAMLEDFHLMASDLVQHGYNLDEILGDLSGPRRANECRQQSLPPMQLNATRFDPVRSLSPLNHHLPREALGDHASQAAQPVALMESDMSLYSPGTAGENASSARDWRHYSDDPADPDNQPLVPRRLRQVCN